jgi:hypothetical protein
MYKQYMINNGLKRKKVTGKERRKVRIREELSGDGRNQRKKLLEGRGYWWAKDIIAMR